MKILLDEHLPKAVAVTLGRLLTGTDAQHIADWQYGRWLAEDDPVLLEGLWQDRRPLASYDRATLPRHLAKRIAGGKDHAGVIFVDQERFPVTRIGDMARGLQEFGNVFQRFPKNPAPSDWINRTVTLTS